MIDEASGQKGALRHDWHTVIHWILTVGTLVLVVLKSDTKTFSVCTSSMEDSQGGRFTAGRAQHAEQQRGGGPGTSRMVPRLTGARAGQATSHRCRTGP